MVNRPLIPTFPVFFQLSNSLNVGTEEIFPGRILKFGRHFERVEKNFNFSTSDPGRLHACTHARMAQFFFLRIGFFGTTHGDRPTSQNGISLRSPSLIMAPGKGHLIENLPLLREIYKDPSLLSCRKGRSLKDVLVRAN